MVSAQLQGDFWGSRARVNYGAGRSHGGNKNDSGLLHLCPRRRAAHAKF